MERQTCRKGGGMRVASRSWETRGGDSQGSQALLPRAVSSQGGGFRWEARGSGAGPTGPAGLALVLGSVAAGWLQPGTELPVGCGEWLQDLNVRGLGRKFSLRKSQSVEPDVCGSELKWTPSRGPGEAGGEWQDPRGPCVCQGRMGAQPQGLLYFTVSTCGVGCDLVLFSC